jgi:hypothetical protein
MFEKLLNLAVLLFLFFDTVKSQAAICSATNTSNVFNLSQYVRFQTPNYPTTMQNDSAPVPCNANFTAANPNDYLWFTFINGEAIEILISDSVNYASPLIYYETNHVITTFTSLTGKIGFQFFDQLNQVLPWTALDAVVLPFSPSSTSKCPFADQTITLNSTTVIPISSDFGVNATVANCSWTFLTEPNYQFKILIKQLTSTYRLIMKNDSTTNVFEIVIPRYSPQVIYLSGSQLNIMLTNIKNIPEHNGFFAVISAVPINPVYTEKCTILTNNGITNISNLDLVNGYDDYSVNIFCFLPK